MRWDGKVLRIRSLESGICRCYQFEFKFVFKLILKAAKQGENLSQQITKLSQNRKAFRDD